LINFFRVVDTRELHMEVCCTSGEKGGLAPEVEALGVPVWTCAYSPYGYLSFMRRFEAELHRRGRYDVVHTHNSNWGGPALEVARRLGVPVRIAEYHNAAPGHKNDLPRRLVERWMRSYVRKAATGIAGCAWAALKWSYPDYWDVDPRMFVIRYGI